MKIFNLRFSISLLTILTLSRYVRSEAFGNSARSCAKYSSAMNNVRSSVIITDVRDLILEQRGFVTPHYGFGARFNDKCTEAVVQSAKLHTAGAQKFKQDFGMSANDYESIAMECDDVGRVSSQCRKNVRTSHEKYRSIDGRNNNLKNPDWGSSGTPFARFGSRNYEDGVYAIKKSADGSNLPNARLLVEKVLTKAVRSAPSSLSYNVLGLLIILFATHDMHYQVPAHPRNSEEMEFQCCTHDRSGVLPRNLSNSACLPIEVAKNDTMNSDGKVGCINMVRSQVGEYQNTAQAGQILNQATSYLDLSLIYGNNEAEMKKVRLYKNGKFRMGKNNVLPVDSNGRYLKSMDRYVVIPIASIWPALFARNHNHLAERLASLNRHWTDEIVFQEARRINIAIFQYNLITAKSIERVFKKPVNESYSEKRNAATFVEFSYTYRGAHYYVPSEMLFLDGNYTQTKQVLQSDTIRKIELLEDDFDGALRGVSNQNVNTGPYSDEIINRIRKNKKDGYGTDLAALDIQRSRDHGIPSFAEIRRRCKLTPEINSFDDFNLIFNKTNVDLLKSIYTSHEDVDFYVGGMLEAFERVGNPFAGETFGCIIGENYNNAMGGDIYFYTHPQNPYPMTPAQIEAISQFSVSHLFCINSGLTETNKLWSYAPHPMNPKINCSNYKQMDLSAWKE